MEIPYIFNKENQIIKGYSILTLEVGKCYEIHYGINQGIYRYLGKVSKEDKNHPFSHGQYMFENCKTKELFGYYGNSPYEFTNIVSAI